MDADHVSGDSEMPVRLYWTDGRVEDVRQPLNVIEHPEIIRNTEAGHVQFLFNGHIDPDGFAVYEERD